eukprot:g4032.t1
MMNDFHLKEKLDDSTVKSLQIRLNKKIEEITGSKDEDEMMAEYVMVMVQNLKTMKDVSSSLEDLATSPEDCEKIVAWLASELGYSASSESDPVPEKKKEKKKEEEKNGGNNIKLMTALSAPRHDNRKKRREPPTTQ